MFKYVFFILCVVNSFWGVAAVTPVALSRGDLNASKVLADSVLQENSSDSLDEEDGDEPSLEEPSTLESNTFDAGTPPVTEDSLEEEDEPDTNQSA